MNDPDDTHALLRSMDQTRQRFMDLVAEVRPELHRYCSRMTGNVFDGEDVLQDTLAKAYFALSHMDEPPPLRYWLFRIAYNTALDFMRRFERKNVELVADLPANSALAEQGPDRELVEAALAAFVVLPPIQRSAIVLKDVLGHSLEQTAVTMGTTVAAVKAALARARANLATGAPSPSVAVADLESLVRYAALFNARDWDGLRALLGEEARLDLVSRSQRRGSAAESYFSRYSEVVKTEELRVEVGLADGVPALAFFRPGSTQPAYFVRLEWEGGRVVHIQDYRYVPYIAQGARFTKA
jgi:RNA polymerase sigma-70 factor (ECF subfamily)